MALRRARWLPAILLALSLTTAACSDYHIVTIPKSVTGSVQLPPIGFNHLYGENPIAARDGLTLERQFWAGNVYWEVFLYTQPIENGFVSLGNAAAVQAARHRITGLILTVATEDTTTINRFLAFPGLPGQKTYAEAMLHAVEGFGYDSVSTAQVRIYFGELNEYANLTWNQSTGYNYKVLLNGFGEVQGVTPLPTPETPTTVQAVPSTTSR